MWSYQTTRAATLSIASHTASSAAETYSSQTFTRTVLPGAGVSGSVTSISISEAHISFYSTGIIAGSAGAYNFFTIGTTPVSQWEVWILGSTTTSQNLIGSGSAWTYQTSTNATATDYGTSYVESTTASTISMVRAGFRATTYTIRMTSSFSSRTIDNTVFGVVVSTTSTVSTASSSSSQDGTPSFRYTSGSTSTNKTLTQTVSTTQSSSFRTYGSTSTGTTVGTLVTSTLTTRSGTSSYSITWSATQTTATTDSTILTATALQSVLLDSVIEIGSNDWFWEFTTRGSGPVSDLATRVTTSRTTYSQSLSSVAPSTYVPVTVTYSSSANNAGDTEAAATTFTDSTTRASTATTTGTARTHSTSTYEIGGTGGTANLTATRTYSTSVVTTWTYHSTSLSTRRNFPASWQSALSLFVTFSDTVTTTQTAEPQTFTTSIMSWSSHGFNSADAENVTNNTSFSTSTSFRSNISLGGSTRVGLDRVVPEGNSPFGNDTSYQMNAWEVFTLDSNSSTTRSHDLPAVGSGFQTAPSIGGTYGTNISITGTKPAFGKVFGGVAIPFVYSTDTRTFVVLGSVNNSLRRANATATVTGGFGWSRDTSERTKVTLTEGNFHYTSQNSTRGTTTGTTAGNLTASTLTISHGNAIALQRLPRVTARYTDNFTGPCLPYVTYSAFPSS